MHKQQSALTVILKLVFSGLTSVVLIALGTANPGVCDGQGGLACCDPWGRKESDTTELLNWTELTESSVTRSVCFHFFEVQSQNWGSCCHGYSLVIMSLTFSTWWGFQSLQDSSQDMAQNIVYSPWEGTKGPWLCLITKLLLFSLVGLFSSVSAFSHFSD